MSGFGSLLLLFASTIPAAEPRVDFARDVRPILAEHCFLCHGPDELGRKGKLRLDQRADALRAGRSGAIAIVPGQPDASEVLRRILTDDASEVMPPPKHKKPLTAAQIDTLKRWISAGAPYDGHWAFTAPQRPTGTLDGLIQARLKHAKLSASPAAPPEMLVRRLYLDLIGLPPTPTEVREFVTAANHDRTAAVAGVVDHLLARPQFGEKWARHWLDVARYADSDGYEKDLPRQQWAYRDWVVRALNADLPYDQFLIHQLAGDLLPNATQDHRIATGFLRNAMVNEEGAIIAEQFRHEALFDRMDAVGKTVLGLSLQCAQCHTHKYDPISHREYYSLFAFLNNDYEAQSWVYTPEQLATIRNLHTATATAETKLKAAHPDWATRLTAWAREQQKVQTPWQVLHPTDASWGGGLCHPTPLPDGSVLTLGHKGVKGDLTVLTATKQARVTGIRLDALTHGDLPFNGPGRSPTGTFALAELVVETSPGGSDPPKWTKVTLAPATADVSPAARPLEAFYRSEKDGKPDKRTVGPAAFLSDGNDDTAWCPDRGPGRRNVSSHAVVPFATPVEHAAGVRLRVTLKFRHAGADGYGRNNNFLGRFRLSTTDAAKPTADPYGPDVRVALAHPDAALVFTAWRQTQPNFAPINTELDQQWATYPEATTSVLHLAARSPEHARTTALLDRGAWDKPKEAVTPGTLAALHPLPADAAPNRLTFARWCASTANPLTARVQVNRVWQNLWGTGIVETAEEFGTRGAAPTHPDVLDWLAVEFMERGWSLKHLLRTIVTSTAYQQTSTITPAMLERDPKNALLARGPRFRVDAEVMRDVVLATSGLLNPTIGGPYRFPPVPDSLLTLSYAKVDFWQTAEGPERYRRSLYLFRRRSLPDPLLSCFDAPTGDTSTPRRQRSNTPLAALAALNEPVLVEASRALALRILREGGGTESARIEHAFWLCVSRAPSAAEAKAVQELLAATRTRLADGWLSAKEILAGTGDRLPALPPATTPADAAVWTVAARVLLNLDETLTKN